MIFKHKQQPYLNQKRTLTKFAFLPKTVVLKDNQGNFSKETYIVWLDTYNILQVFRTSTVYERFEGKHMQDWFDITTYKDKE